MHQLIKQKAKIYSAGAHLPAEIVKSEDIFAEFDSEVQYNMPHNWMTKTMGIEERRVAPMDAKPSDLAIPAAVQALEGLKGFNPQEIDLVIFCGIERDQPEPATAHIIQHKLGLKARYAFDMANACFGFIDAMQIASSYVECGITRYALVVTGEVPTKVARSVTNRLKKGVDIATLRTVIGALSVGDAGGAVVIGPTERNDTSGFELFNTISLSEHAEKCIYKTRNDGSIEGRMLMEEITLAILRGHYKLIQSTLFKLGWDSFDWMLSHQMGQKPFDKLSDLECIRPSRMIKTLDKLGNITSATFPVNFQKLLKNGKSRKGDKIGGCFTGSGLVVGQFGYIL